MILQRKAVVMLLCGDSASDVGKHIISYHSLERLALLIIFSCIVCTATRAGASGQVNKAR